MRTYFFILTLSLGLFSVCELEKKQEAQAVLFGTYTLDSDSSHLFVTDYVPDINLIKKISINPKDISVELSGDKKEILIVSNGESSSYLYNLDFHLENQVKSLLIKRPKKEKVTFKYKADQAKVKNIRLKGEMNGWNAKGTDFKYEDGFYRYNISLSPGEYQYLFIVDGKEMLDPNNSNTVDNNIGGTNSLLKINDNKIKLPVISTKSHAKDKVSVEVENEFNCLYVFWDNRLIKSVCPGSTNKEIEITIPKRAKSYPRSFLRVYAANKYGIANDVLIPLNYDRVVSSATQLNRFDKHTQIMYFLMVDRFSNGNPENDFPLNSPEVHPRADYHGGDLEGVIRKIEDGYFDRLGFNTIWLSPITQNPSSAYGLWPNPRTKFSGFHGYWPVSSSKIDYHFGVDADLHLLVKKAQDKNMNVILDYVANHVHEDHPVIINNPHWKTELYLPDGTLNTERWDDYRLTTWFDTFLPTLDLSNPEVIEAMSDSALYWITKFKLDGFRHDATKHIDEAFWRVLTRKIRDSTDYPIYQVGETYGSRGLIKSYISPGMLDAQFDFNVYDDAVATFAKENSSFKRLSNSIKESHNYYGVNNLMGYISGNQDRARVISYASGDVSFDEDAKLAGWTRQIDITDSTAFNKVMQLYAFNFTIPGIPCMYYGDEIGMPGGNDPDNRRMMRFEGLTKRETKLRDQVAQLAELRSNNMPLLYGDFKEVFLEKDVWVYSRSYFNEKAICLFNKSSETKTIKLPVNVQSSKLTVAFNNRVKHNKEMLEVKLPAYSTEIILINKNKHE